VDEPALDEHYKPNNQRYITIGEGLAKYFVRHCDTNTITSRQTVAVLKILLTSRNVVFVTLKQHGLPKPIAADNLIIETSVRLSFIEHYVNLIW
jgi:hypothetical protein